MPEPPKWRKGSRIGILQRRRWRKGSGTDAPDLPDRQDGLPADVPELPDRQPGLARGVPEIAACQQTSGSEHTASPACHAGWSGVAPQTPLPRAAFIAQRPEPPDRQPVFPTRLSEMGAGHAPSRIRRHDISVVKRAVRHAYAEDQRSCVEIDLLRSFAQYGNKTVGYLGVGTNPTHLFTIHLLAASAKTGARHGQRQIHA